MPLLGPDDPLPLAQPPTRVLVAGTSGSGKTTLAAAIGSRLALPHTEIDALYHGPGWAPRAEFDADVDALVAGERWVTEWQYSAARPRLVARADLLVWLDLPVPQVMWQVTRRTVMRRARRQELWNGNVEGSLIEAVRGEGIIRWAWDTRHSTRERVTALLPTRPDLPVVRLRSHRESARWLARLPGPARSSRPGALG